MNEKALRRIVADEFRLVLDGLEPSDQECRSACTRVLKAIQDFLRQSDSHIPLVFLRETVSRIIQEIGPGDSLFRTRWRGILLHAKSVDSLKFALEFVDCTIPPQNDDATAEVIKSLERMAAEHHEVIVDIFHALRQLVISQKLTKKTAFHFIVECISKVPHSSIEDALYCLLDHVSDNDDLSVAIDCVRGDRMKPNDDTDIDRPMDLLESISSTVIKFQQDQMYERFFEEYLSSLENLCTLTWPDDGIDNARSLNEIDLVILLLHRLHKEHGTYVIQLLNHAVMNDVLDLRMLRSLTRLLVKGSDEDDKAKSQRLLGLHRHLVWLLVFLCVGPLRNSKVWNLETVASLAVEFGSALMELSGSAQQQVVVSALLQVNELCLHHFDSRNLDSAEETTAAMQRVQSMVVQILMACAGLLCSIMKSEATALVRTLNCNYVTTTTAANLCRILISAGQLEDRKEGLLELTRSMLFSRGDGFTNEKDQGGSQGRKIKGLILMAEMVKSERCDPIQLSLLWQSLRLVLLNPTDRAIDPKIGIHGLKAVRAFHVWLQSCNNESKFVPHSEIFPTMTSILMNSRLVQYANATAKSLRKDPVELGYSVRPEFVTVQSTKQRVYHKMIFSFDALLDDKILLSPGSWVFSSRWVHDLIDVYLTLGRTKSKGKWIPHAWVEAAFGFPVTDISCLRPTNSRQQRMVEIVIGRLREYGACSETVISTTSLDKDFGDALKQVKSPIERSKLVRGLLRISLSYCLALALSAGILRNTFAHYSGILGSEDEKRDEERKEATRMMQYQLAKIYDLVGKCQMLECIFRGISSVNLRGKRRHKKVPSILGSVIFDSAVQLAIEKLPPITSSFISTDEYVGTKILWHCLVDPSNDSLIIKKMEQELTSSNESTEMDFASFDGIIELRLNIMRHLTAHFSCFSKRNLNMKPRHPPDSVRQELEMIQPIFAQSLRLASYLSMILSSHVYTGVHAGRLSRIATLTGAYFRLLLLVMEINLEGCSDDAIETCYCRYRSLYQSIMGSEQPLTDAIGTVVGRQESFKSIKNSLVKHLSKCRNMLIATEFLETLSVFALYSNTRESIQEMVGISWVALHSQFPSGDEPGCSISMPRAFLEALRRLSPAVFIENSKLRALKDTAVRETILKSALRRPKPFDESFFQLHCMVRHWGFLALAEKFCPICADHLHELYMTLQSFFSSVKELHHEKHKVRKDGGSSDDDEYIPPKPKQSVVRLALPEATGFGLGLKNYCTYFQILLDMTVSSSALFAINDGPDWVDPLNGPYRELCKIIETFGSLVDVYRKRIYAFPPQFLSAVLNACRSMLNVVAFQCTECIKWRSSQPAPTADQIEARTFDAAAVQYLGRIFDLFGVHVIGTLDSLCSFFIESTNGSERVTLAPGHQQKVKALRVKTSKISLELEKYAAAHQLPSPRKAVAESENGQPSRKRRRIEIKGFLQFEESAEESEDTYQRAALSTAVQVNRSVTEHRASNNDLYSSELTWDASTSDQDDSFGADGDWGRESEEELETG